MRAPCNLVVSIIEKNSDKKSKDLNSSPGLIMICVM